MLDWNNQVYKTVTNTYNGRDQITLSRIDAGDTSSTTFRDSTSIYDGHGRLISAHTPQQDANTATTYTYWPDDKPATITDARGATKHYSYNSRGLITDISWTVPSGSGITLTPSISYSYDNAGNRVSMEDGAGEVTYARNSLSQITSETREFNETVTHSPTGDNKFSIQYTYAIGGRLKSYTDPFNETISYGLDKAGRVISTSGSVNYITSASYRAWGSPKSISCLGNKTMSLEFNNRLQATRYTFGATRLDYTYYSDGRLKTSDTDYNFTGSNYEEWPRFDRSYEYDFLGRLTAAKTGAEANGQTELDAHERPYRITKQYNHFGEVTYQTRNHYLLETDGTFAFSNGRLTSETRTTTLPGWIADSDTTNHTFDADGRETDNGQTYDAEGRQIKFNKGPESAPASKWLEAKYDGDGRIIITNDKYQFCAGGCTYLDNKKFRVVSSVLGETVSELEYRINVYPWVDNYRQKFVYSNGVEVARQQIGIDYLYIKSVDPSGVEHTRSYELESNFYELQDTVDVFGAGIGLENPYPEEEDAPDPQDPGDCNMFDHDEQCPDEPEEFEDPDSEQAQTGSVNENTCYIDGVEQENCDQAFKDAGVSDDTPVKKYSEFEDHSPSDNGPQAIHQDDDQTTSRAYGPTADDLVFEGANTGMEGAAADIGKFDGGNISMADYAEKDVIGTAADFDLHGEAAADPVRRLSKREVGKIASDMQKIFDANPDCLPFISDILSIAEKPNNPLVSKNPIDVLWAVYQRGSMNVASIGLHGGEAQGSLGHNAKTGPNLARIDLAPRNFDNRPDPAYGLPASWSRKMNRTQELLRAGTTIAESIHKAGYYGGYDDREMSLAVAAKTKQPPPNYPFKLYTDVTAWSNWWHPQVDNRCDIKNVLKAEGF